MPLLENELARRESGRLVLRADPLRLHFEFADLITADGHELRCHYSIGVRAIDDRTERQALEQSLLSGKTKVSTDDVVAYFRPKLATAAARNVAKRPVRELIEEDAARASLVADLNAAAAAVAFASGLETVAPFNAETRSPTYERQRVAAMQQALLEQQSAAQAERMTRTGELLKQFQALRAAAPDLPAGRVLEQVSPADRGSLMGAMLLAGARGEASATLWAVAGPHLVEVRMHFPIEGSAAPAATLIALPQTLGPLRSVQSADVDGEQVLLIGAQRGFFRLAKPRTDNPQAADAQPYTDAGVVSSLGFNRVIYWRERRQFVASHSEAGIVCWDLAAPDKPARVARPPELGLFPNPDAMANLPPSSNSMSLAGGGLTAGPRNIGAVDERTLIFSAGARVLTWNGEHVKPVAETSTAEVVSILFDAARNIVVHGDGTIGLLDPDGRLLSTSRPGGRVRSAAMLPWLGESRLLLGCDDGPVICLGTDDPLVTHYASAHRGLRSLSASSQAVAGVTSDRGRLVLWNAWEPRQPAAELPLSAQTRHRIGDITFA